jgi:Ca2+-binding EF-hand superfamily protein
MCVYVYVCICILPQQVIFRLWNVNEDEHISFRELVAVLSLIYFGDSYSQYARMFEAVDVNDNDSLDYEEIRK